MPNPVNNRRGEQWDTCGRCGLLYPMSQLTTQKGLLVCTIHCVDDLTIERHAATIQEVLNAGAETEGVDLRYVDGAFFVGPDEELY